MPSEDAQDPPAAMSSPAQDIRRVRQNSAATADELRAFLAEMRGKSPSEMLGAIATASLFKALIQACIAAAILIALLTVLPFVWGKMRGGGDDAAEVAEAEAVPEQSDPASAGDAPPADAPQETAAAGPAPASANATTPPAGAAETLGIGDAPEVPADVNPLDGSNDDLLKGLE